MIYNIIITKQTTMPNSSSHHHHRRLVIVEADLWLPRLVAARRYEPEEEMPRRIQQVDHGGFTKTAQFVDF